MRLFPTRRWLRFSIRTLLLAVTIFCVWLGWQVSIVREREAVKSIAESQGVEFVTLEVWDEKILPEYDPYRLSFMRRWLGDKLQWVIHLDHELDPDTTMRLGKAFPEADIRIWDGRPDIEYRPNLYGIKPEFRKPEMIILP